MQTRKHISGFLLSLPMAVAAWGQAVPVANVKVLSTVLVNYQAHPIAGDTNIATSFLSTGTFTWVEPDGTNHVLNGDVITTLNDPSFAGCQPSSSICIIRVVKIDFQTPS